VFWNDSQSDDAALHGWPEETFDILPCPVEDERELRLDDEDIVVFAREKLGFVVEPAQVAF